MLAGTGRVTMGRETAMSARCLLAGDNAWVTWTWHLNFYKLNVLRVWAVPLSAMMLRVSPFHLVHLYQESELLEGISRKTDSTTAGKPLGFALQEFNLAHKRDWNDARIRYGGSSAAVKGRTVVAQHWSLEASKISRDLRPRPS